MSHYVWFNVPLTCLDCGARIPGHKTGLDASGLHPEPRGETLEPGETLTTDEDRFNVAYVRVRNIENVGEVRIVAGWCCPINNTGQWARVVFCRESNESFRLVSAESVRSTPAELREAHFIGEDVEYWIQAGPSEETEGLLEALGPDVVLRKPV